MFWFLLPAQAVTAKSVFSWKNMGTWTVIRTAEDELTYEEAVAMYDLYEAEAR